MSQFARADETYTLTLSLDEAHILINLTEQLLELLGEGDFQHHYDESDPFAALMAMQHEIAAPEDPVLRRLLPNAYADPEAADDFRRYTEPAIRKGKQNSLRIIREELLVIVDSEQTSVIKGLDPQLWLKTLNDLRLALSVRLEIQNGSFEIFENMPDENPQKAIYAVYFWLGWLQENLLELLNSETTDH